MKKHPYFGDTPNSLLTHCRISRQYNAIQYNKNICNTGENRRAESQPLCRKKHLDSFIRFDTTPFSERQKGRHGQTTAEQPMANTPLTKRSADIQLPVHTTPLCRKKTVVNLAKCLRQISKTLGLVRVQRAPANDVSAALCAFAAAGARFRAFVA